MWLRWIEDNRVALLLIKSTRTLSHTEHQLAQLRLWHIGSRSGFRKAGAPPWSILACSASEHVMYQNKNTPQNLGCSGHTASCKKLFKQSSLCVTLKHHPTKRTFTCNRPKGTLAGGCAAAGRPAPSEMLAWQAVGWGGAARYLGMLCRGHTSSGGFGEDNILFWEVPLFWHTPILAKQLATASSDLSEGTVGKPPGWNFPLA